MTSFAAAGWVEEDGVWYYYDSDGNIVEDEWKKSGDDWYFFVKTYKIRLYTNEKELTPKYTEDKSYDLDNWKEWD